MFSTDELKQLSKEFEITKGQLFFKKSAGFLGRILAQVKFSWNEDIETAGINSSSLLWCPKFYANLNKESRITVLAHELWHNALLHGVRCGTRCPETWNVAGDHVINLFLREHGYDFSQLMSMFPEMPIDPKYKGWTTDEVYDDLIKQGGKPLPFLGMDILYPNGDSDLDSETASAVAKIVSAITGAKMMGTEPGMIPGEVELIIDQFLNPQLPWEVLFYNFFNALTDPEYSWARQNRRYEDPMLPGLTKKNGLEHLVHYQDVSGSVGDNDILIFNSELKHIKDEFEPELMTVVTFDTKIQNEYIFEKDDPFEKIIVSGRGGTSLTCVMEHVKKLQDVTAMIVFTDLFVSIPPDPGIPIIWICVNNPGKTVPYGKLIHLKT